MKDRTARWIDSAEGDLGNTWLLDGRSERVTKASYEIDQKLTHDPFEFGLPLSEGLFVIEEPPLRNVFEIAEDKRIVRVLSAGLL